jgi:hypothetical protein
MYIVTLLRDGYHFDENARDIIFTSKINGNDVGWALGAMLYEANLLPFDIVRVC